MNGSRIEGREVEVSLMRGDRIWTDGMLSPCHLTWYHKWHGIIGCLAALSHVYDKSFPGYWARLFSNSETLSVFPSFDFWFLTFCILLKYLATTSSSSQFSEVISLSYRMVGKSWFNHIFPFFKTIFLKNIERIIKSFPLFYAVYAISW